MHQGSATRKLQLAGAAAGGLALGDAFSTKSRNVLEDRVHTETRMLLGAGTDSASVATGHDRSSKPTMAIAGPSIPSLEMLMPTLAQTATAPSTPRAPNSVVEPE
jgi:hypothetical protein